MQTTSTFTTISTLTMLLGIILMAGSIWGAILLFKDAKKHKKFAKIIRIISGIIQLLAIVGSIIIVSLVFSNPQSVWARAGIVMTILFAISIVSIVTNIRWGILLFIESKRSKGFSKRIRIICWIIMIISLFSSFATGI